MGLYDALAHRSLRCLDTSQDELGLMRVFLTPRRAGIFLTVVGLEVARRLVDQAVNSRLALHLWRHTDCSEVPEGEDLAQAPRELNNAACVVSPSMASSPFGVARRPAGPGRHSRPELPDSRPPEASMGPRGRRHRLRDVLLELGKICVFRAHERPHALVPTGVEVGSVSG